MEVMVTLWRTRLACDDLLETHASRVRYEARVLHATDH